MTMKRVRVWLCLGLLGLLLAGCGERADGVRLTRLAADGDWAEMDRRLSIAARSALVRTAEAAVTLVELPLPSGWALGLEAVAGEWVFYFCQQSKDMAQYPFAYRLMLLDIASGEAATLTERAGGRAELREITELEALGNSAYWIEAFGESGWRIMGYSLERAEIWQVAAGQGQEPRLTAYLVQHGGWPEKLLAGPQANDGRWRYWCTKERRPALYREELASGETTLIAERLAIEGAVQALYAEAGALVIATSQGVYRYDEAGLSCLYDQSGLLHFQRLADTRLAFQSGGRVVLLDIE